MESLSFIFVCAGTIALLFAVAALCEKKFCSDIKQFSGTHYISYTAVFACMSGVLMCLELPLFFAPSFYKLDLSEMPVLICTFYLGPVAGISAELLKVLIKLLLKGTSTAFVGDFANFVIGCSFIFPASLIYHAKPGKKTALLGMGIGTVCLTVFGSAFNAFYLIPKFAVMYGTPVDAIISMGTGVNPSITSLSTLVLFAVAPFNLLKGVAVSVLTFLLYKRISPVLHKNDARKVQRNRESRDKIS